jgi:hypothetical protein
VEGRRDLGGRPKGAPAKLQHAPEKVSGGRVYCRGSLQSDEYGPDNLLRQARTGGQGYLEAAEAILREISGGRSIAAGLSRTTSNGPDNLLRSSAHRRLQGGHLRSCNMPVRGSLEAGLLPWVSPRANTSTGRTISRMGRTISCRQALRIDRAAANLLASASAGRRRPAVGYVVRAAAAYLTVDRYR